MVVVVFVVLGIKPRRRPGEHSAAELNPQPCLAFSKDRISLTDLAGLTLTGYPLASATYCWGGRCVQPGVSPRGCEIVSVTKSQAAVPKCWEEA